MATAEALAYSLKIPLRAVDTLEAISYNPVSYTHLDVYKRQLLI